MKKIILFTIICVFLSCKGQTKSAETEEVVSSFEYLSEEELKAKTKEELRLLRNEIFARKGYVFKSEDLSTYFKTKTWYKPDAKVTVALSDEEQNYIDRVKAIENNLDSKVNNCSNELIKQSSELFPLISKNLLERGSKYNSILSQTIENINEIVYGNLCAGGYVWNIKCYDSIKYQLMFYNCVDNDPFVKLAIIKNNDDVSFLELYGSSLFGEDSIESFYDIDFKLNENSLEVYKIFQEWDKENITEENRYPTKEVRREVTKYKLTENGIVEL